MKQIGIYHSRDFDGLTSAAIMKLKYPNIVLIGYDYGEPFDFNQLKDSEVIMSDVSFSMPEMKKIFVLTNGNFTWIDHHISAINEYEEYKKENPGLKIETVLNTKFAACELTWHHLFPDLNLPLGVKLLGRYDVFDKKDKKYFDEVILPFQYGMRYLSKDINDYPNYILINNNKIDDIINIGKITYNFEIKQNEKTAKANSFEFNFDGLRAICLNSSNFSSLIFDSIYNPDKHDIMFRFNYNGKEWIVSLYSEKPNIDCSKYAKSYGGGGHKGAAGFQIKDINNILNLK